MTTIEDGNTPERVRFDTRGVNSLTSTS